MSCAAFLATFGLALADIDRRKVYEIPKSRVTELTVSQRWLAKACAVRHGIHYRIVEER